MPSLTPQGSRGSEEPAAWEGRNGCEGEGCSVDAGWRSHAEGDSKHRLLLGQDRFRVQANEGSRANGILRGLIGNPVLSGQRDKLSFFVHDDTALTLSALASISHSAASGLRWIFHGISLLTTVEKYIKINF